MSLDEMPPLVESAMHDSDNSDDYMSEDEDSNNLEPTNCLFCTEILPSVDAAILHLKNNHKIDLNILKQKFNMDQYSYIKFINYIRVNKTSVETIQTLESSLWNDEKYLKPGDYEPWLTYDFEGLTNGSNNLNIDCTKNGLNLENLVDSLTEIIKKKDNLLEQAAEDMEKLRTGFQRFVNKDIEPEKPRNSIASISLEADESYFSSYAHFGIHHEMLSDTVRTESYRDALLKNKEFLSKKLVLDLGCGTSVLSMFASQAGAEKIVAIDNSEIIYNAIAIAEKNNFKNIDFVKGRLEDTELPIEKFDIIISEWMGYFLVFEGMLDSVIYARDRHLKLGGTLMPNRCTINLCGYGDLNRYSELISFWDSVYGIDMSSMKHDVLREPLIEICKPEFILTDSNIIVDYNLYKIDLNYSNFDFNFKLKCNKNGTLTSFIGYFDTFFDLPNAISFSTSANDKSTHWKQVVFFLEKPITIETDQIIEGKIVVKRSKKDLRKLDVNIKVFNKEYVYYLD